MSKKKVYQYYLLKAYAESRLNFPEGLLVMYNYAMPSYDSVRGQQIFGYVEFDRPLSQEEIDKNYLREAVVDDSWI